MSQILNRSLTALTLTLAFHATGCFGNSTGPGPGGTPVVVGSGAPAPNYATTPVSPIVGGAPGLDQGTAGYIITANVGSFRFTWTGYAEFRGSIFLDNTGFGTLIPGCRDGACSLASGEDVVRVGAEPGRIDFVSFPASGKRSGFDVQIPGNTVWVDLLVDGVRQPRLTNFTTVINNQAVPGVAQFMPLALQINVAQLVAGSEQAKVVPAPSPAATWPKPADGGQILALPGMEDARTTLTSEGLQSFRGKAEPAAQ